jgi:hypothetical protein
VILDDTYAEWSDSVLPLFSYTPNDIYGTSDVPPYFGDGWINFKRIFYVLPGDGDIEISLAANGYSDIYNCFKDIKFYSTNYKILQKTIKRKLRQRIIWNSGIGGSFLDLRNKYYTVKYKEEIEPIVENIIERTNIDSGIDLPFDFKIGDVTKESDPVYSGDTAIDNIVEQFAGSLAFNQGTNAQQSVLIGGSGAATLEIIIEDIDFHLNRGSSQSTADAIDSFMVNNGSAYLENSIVLNRASNALFFTKLFKGISFDGDLSVNIISGDISGMILTPTEATNDFVYTTSWETLQNGENKPLLEIIADELMELNIRPKQILQLPFNEFMDQCDCVYPEFHVNGFLEDSLNKDDSDTNRRYMIISASFNVRDRSWNCDLWELIRKPEISEND